MIPLAYETRYINKLFLISLQLFDYTVSRIQYFRSNKTPPESHRRWKILSLLLAGESLCHSSGPWEGESPASKWCPSVSVALTQVMSSWQIEITPGQFSVLGAVHLFLFYLSTHMLVLGMGRGLVQDSISCGSNKVQKRQKDIAFSKPLLLPCAWDFFPPSLSYNLYDRKWLLFLWITFHAIEV